MKTDDFFSYTSYKQLLRDRIAAAPRRGFGLRRRLADASGCQTAYLSQVLNGRAHLSLEQANAIGGFFRFPPLEMDYFLGLVQWERAGTPSLKTRFKRQLARTAQEASVIQKRIEINRSLTTEHQATYYSNWCYVAIHMALTMPVLQTPLALERFLGLSGERVQAALEFLVGAGIAERAGERYRSRVDLVHLPPTSPLIAMHHANWRLRAIQAVESAPAEGFHYSGVVTVSAKDVERIRQVLLAALQDAVRITQSSGSDEMRAIAIDFFALAAVR